MKIGDWLGRRTWLGLAVSLLIWAGMGLLGAGLMLKGLVPEMTGEWLAVSWAAASFTGGRVEGEAETAAACGNAKRSAV